MPPNPPSGLPPLPGGDRLAPVDDIFEHYRIFRKEDGRLWELGHGSMGVTYKAIDTNLDAVVALKIINGQFLDKESSRQRFRREARAAASLRHRNVSSVYHLGQSGQSFFYAMEFVDGQNVEAIVERDGPLPWRRALSITLQVTRALMAAHVKNLVHRDIKPANIMVVDEVDETDVAKLIDFGLAKSAVEAEVGEGVTNASGFLGTPLYASPEQCEELAADVRSDIYSLGITLWFMLTGHPTFEGSLARVFQQQLYGAPPFEKLPADLPLAVRTLLERMLAKDRANRPQTPTDLRTEIEACLHGNGGKTALPPKKELPPRKDLPPKKELPPVIIPTKKLPDFKGHKPEPKPPKPEPEKTPDPDDGQLSDGTGSSRQEKLPPWLTSRRIIYAALGLAILLLAVPVVRWAVQRHPVDPIPPSDSPAPGPTAGGVYENMFSKPGSDTPLPPSSAVPATTTVPSAQVQGLLTTARDFMKAQRWQEAATAYAAVLTVAGDSMEALVERGNAGFFLGDEPAMESAFNRAIQLTPGNAIDQVYQGIALRRMGQDARAAAQLAAGRRIDPHDARENYLRAYSRTSGESSLALRDYDEVIQLEPDNARAFSDRGNIYNNTLSQYPRALQDYEAALAINPRSYVALNNRATAYVSLREWDRAEHDLNQAIQLNPRFALPYFARASMYSKRGLYQKAIPDYDEVIRLNPKHVSAHFERGTAYGSIRQYQKAIADFDETIRLEPNSPGAYVNRGLARYNLGQYQSEIDDLNEALRLDPKNAIAHNNRGDAYAKLGQYDHALTDCNEAIRLDQKNWMPYFNRGNLRLKQRNYGQAIADYNAALALNSGNADIYNNRSMAEDALGEGDSASRDREQAAALRRQGR